jgi:hypothetical protein
MALLDGSRPPMSPLLDGWLYETRRKPAASGTRQAVPLCRVYERQVHMIRSRIMDRTQVSGAFQPQDVTLKPLGGWAMVKQTIVAAGMAKIMRQGARAQRPRLFGSSICPAPRFSDLRLLFAKAHQLAGHAIGASRS